MSFPHVWMSFTHIPMLNKTFLSSDSMEGERYLFICVKLINIGEGSWIFLESWSFILMVWKGRGTYLYWKEIHKPSSILLSFTRILSLYHTVLSSDGMEGESNLFLYVKLMNRRGLVQFFEGYEIWVGQFRLSSQIHMYIYIYTYIHLFIIYIYIYACIYMTHYIHAPTNGAPKYGIIEMLIHMGAAWLICECDMTFLYMWQLCDVSNVYIYICIYIYIYIYIYIRIYIYCIHLNIYMYI